jgi:flavodoxin
MSKILVAYYSKTGNTKRAAEDIARALGADLEIIRDRRNRKGIWAWFASGRDAMKKLKTEIETTGKNPAEYDLIIVGSPVWGWNIAPAVRTYLENNKAIIKNHAFFVTSGNTASEKIAPYIKEIFSINPIAHVGFNAAEMKNEGVYKKKLADFIQFVSDMR